MKIYFSKAEFDLDDFHNENIRKDNTAVHEKVVARIVKDWLEEKPYFTFRTSGSTGPPKTIKIPREKILHSCDATLEKIDPNRNFRTSLLCLNPEMIGGAMVVFRALYRNMDLHVIPASSSPFESIDSTTPFDLVSVVPMQLKEANTRALNRFRTILVGGAPLAAFDKPTTATVYSTFGMTETVSHFALKNVNEAHYECIGDVEIHERDDSRLALKGTLTNNELCITNDLIEFVSPKKFRWIGRADFVINSGGIKLNPETIEAKLGSRIDTPFLITHVPDEKLGQRVVLVVESAGGELPDPALFESLTPYERPRNVYRLDKFILTPSGKVNREATRNLLLGNTKERMG